MGMVIGRGGNRVGSLMRVTGVGVRAVSGRGIVYVYCISYSQQLIGKCLTVRETSKFSTVQSHTPARNCW